MKLSARNARLHPLRSGGRIEGLRIEGKELRRKRKAVSPVPGGEALFQRMFTRIGCEGRPPHFQVEFYPYSSLVITLRRRGDTMIVRFSDLLERAPLAVWEGAAALLLARVHRRRPRKELVRPYLEYARSDRTRERISKMRRRRLRPGVESPSGRHHDLAALFDRLNAKYFEGNLHRPLIAWSRRSWRRQFGCYDPGPNQILLNRRMDRPGVPQFVVEYVLYHEMLHVKHPTRRSGCSLISHSAEFRAEEKRYEHFHAARKFLDLLAR